jgi:hypothetical protein
LVLGDYIGHTGDCSEDTSILPGGGGGSTGGDGDGNTGGGGGTVPPDDPCAGIHSVSPSQAVNSTKEVNIVNPNPPDGSPNPPGDSGFPPPEPPTQPSTPCVIAVPVTIKNNVNDPCLKKMVDATIYAGVTNQINTLVQSVFGNSDKLNLTFVDVTTLDNRVDGNTQPNGFFDANGNLNITVQLNKNTMPHYSQQYISRVIMHEALHAYMIAKSIPPVEQHEDMAISYVTKMASSLQQIFPGLIDSDAKNLALGGLFQTTTFQNTVANDMGLSGSFDAIQSAYSIGSTGTRCN